MTVCEARVAYTAGLMTLRQCVSLLAAVSKLACFACTCKLASHYSYLLAFPVQAACTPGCVWPQLLTSGINYLLQPALATV